MKFAWKNHLSDTRTYQRLSQAELSAKISTVRRKISTFLITFRRSIGEGNFKYIETLTERSSSTAFMYQMPKIHKKPIKTRAIISYSGSICHGLATWIDFELKKIIKHLPYVATSAREVVKKITAKRWSSRARLFTMDAVSMYTNIHLGHALRDDCSTTELDERELE